MPRHGSRVQVLACGPRAAGVRAEDGGGPRGSPLSPGPAAARRYLFTAAGCVAPPCLTSSALISICTSSPTTGPASTVLLHLRP